MKPYLLLTTLLLSTACLATTQHGYQVSYSNFKEFTYVNDPFVEKNTVTASAFINRKTQGIINTEYEGAVGVGVGIHQDWHRSSEHRTTQPNSMIFTNQSAYLSKRVGAIEPQVGVTGFAEYAAMNNRKNLRADAVAGLAFYTGDKKVGVRYNKPFYNTYHYNFVTLKQTDGYGVTVYGEKRKDNLTHGLSVSYQVLDKGGMVIKMPRGWYEPESKKIMIGYYRKW